MREYTREDLNDQSNVDSEGVYRWKSSNNVIPGDILKTAGFSTEELRINAVARNVQVEEFLTQYVEHQQNRSPDQVAEDRYEALAAMGTGVEIVNIITGEKWTT